MEKLIYSKHPVVELCTNRFVEVPVILQYDDQPLIEVVREVESGFATQIPIFHPDGTYLAKVVGARLFTTEEGDKAGLKLEHPQDVTVCKLDGKTLFEIRRVGPAALSATAELHTPDGRFVRCAAGPKPDLIAGDGSSLRVGGVTMAGNTFAGCRIGVWVRSDGSVALGCS